ncbi:MAG: hypothetical protein ABI432_17200 [Flavobacteriales bacterium]
MRQLFLFPSLVLAIASQAQPYVIGDRTIDFFDATRNRTITTDLYYPGVAAGGDVAVATGEFPVLVVGHGFVMGVGSYANFWNYFVPKGYIVALPTTEGGFAPDHAAFGADLAYVAQALQAANVDGASPFFGHVAAASALMGHSMGGGASVLGAAGNASIQAVVSFAPAETDPSAIAAAANVLVPTMVFAASEDCVAPIADHQGPIYDALTVPCRAFVNILGGGHCYFAESNFNCSFGELTCGPDLTISREEQHNVMNDFAGLWLDHYLKGDPQAIVAVLDSLGSSTRVQTEYSCLSTSIAERSALEWSLSPTIANDRIVLSDVPGRALARVCDVTGRVVLLPPLVSAGSTVEVSGLPSGVYHLVLVVNGAPSVRPFVVVH